jgi:hypothetical protein
MIRPAVAASFKFLTEEITAKQGNSSIKLLDWASHHTPSTNLRHYSGVVQVDGANNGVMGILNIALLWFYNMFVFKRQLSRTIHKRNRILPQFQRVH